MVTKGHDLPRVTLVGVINADAALSMPDYRAAERTFQLLVQVAGRAGRSDRPGTVVIQTRNPEHHVLGFAVKHDVRGFTERELADRSDPAIPYPPFGRMALLRLDGVDEGATEAAGHALARAANATAPAAAGLVVVKGPVAAPLARLRGRYRFQVVLRARERRPLRESLLALMPARDKLAGNVRIAIDVDPVQMM
jgi:primosomal protein N' (replication factor Y)